MNSIHCLQRSPSFPGTSPSDPPDYDPTPPSSDFYVEIPPENQQKTIVTGTSPSKLCEICFEAKDPSKFLPISACRHSFCGTCLSGYLSSLTSSAKLIDIPCPSSNCGVLLSDPDVEAILLENPKLAARLRKLKALLIANADPLNLFCLTPDCDSVIRNTAADNRKVTCQKCGLVMCFFCRALWHGRKTCVQALDLEIQAYSKQKNVKLCPKCKSKIEKNEGCNQMTCSRCRHQFCWLCGGEYTPTHFAGATAENAWGCPGMQNLQNEEEYRKFRNWRRVKWGCRKAGLLLWPVGALMFVVLAVCLLLPWLYSVYFEPKNKRDYAVLLGIGVLGIPLIPVSLVLIIFPGSWLMYREYKTRKQGK